MGSESGGVRHKRVGDYQYAVFVLPDGDHYRWTVTRSDMSEGVSDRFGKQLTTGTAKDEVEAWLLAESWLNQFLAVEKERLARWANETPPGKVPQADRERFVGIRQKMVLDMPSLPAAGAAHTEHWVGFTDDDLAFLDRLKKRFEQESKRPDSSPGR